MKLSLLLCLLLALRVHTLPSKALESEMDNRGDKEKYYHEQVQLQMLEKEVAREMTGTLSKGIPAPSNDIACRDGGSESTLTNRGLMILINSVFHFFGDTSNNNQFYGTTDYGLTVVKDQDPLKILWDLKVEAQQPRVIWLNYPPFINTSHFLMSAYMNVAKPTIEILGMFKASDDLTVTIEELKCLAKLKQLGFVLRHWDFEDFKSHMDALTCKEVITMGTSSDGFMKELGNVQTLLEHVNEISHTSSASEWCKLPVP